MSHTSDTPVRVIVTARACQILEVLLTSPLPVLSAAAIAAQTGLPMSTVRDNLIRLTAAGWLTTHDTHSARRQWPGRYRIASPCA